MSRERIVTGRRSAAVFREEGQGGQCVVLVEKENEGAGTLVGALLTLDPSGQGLPEGRMIRIGNWQAVALAEIDEERFADDAARGQMALLTLGYLEGLTFGPAGEGDLSGTDRWNALLGLDNDDEQDIGGEDRHVNVPEEDVYAWGGLVDAQVKSNARLRALVSGNFWTRNVNVTRPMEGPELLKALDSWGSSLKDPLLSRMHAQFDSLDLDAARHSLRAVDEVRQEALLYYGANGPESADRRQAAETYPLFAGVIVRNPSLQKIVSERRSLQAGLQEMTGLPPAALRRLAKVDAPPPADPVMADHREMNRDALGVMRQRLYPVSGVVRLEEAVSTLAKLDPSWAPADNESWEAFTAVLGSGAFGLSMMLDRDPAELLKTSRGNWQAWLDTLAREADYDDGEPMDRRRLALSVSDGIGGVYELSQRVLLPLCLSEIAARDVAMPVPSNGAMSAAFGAGMATVCGKAKNPIGALLAFGRTYVSRIGALGEAMEGATDGLHAVTEHYGEDGWPPLMATPWSWGGVTVTALSNARALRQEGSEMGHCLGTYSNRGLKGLGHFLSFKGPGSDRSSLHLEAGVEAGHVVRVEHRTRRNGRVSDVHEQAAMSFMNALRVGEIPLTRGLAEWREKADDMEREERLRNRWGWICGMQQPQSGVVPAVWKEWSGILGGPAAKSDHPGVLFRNREVQNLMRVMSPAAAAIMSDEARRRAEARQAAAETSESPAPAA